MRAGLARRASRWCWVWVALAPLLGSCRGCLSDEAAAATPSVLFTATPRERTVPEVVEWVYSGGLKPGWRDDGWSERMVEGPGPAHVRMSRQGGWALHKPGLRGKFGGLVLRMRAQSNFPDFLEVRLDSSNTLLYPRVRVEARHLVAREETGLRLFIPFEELNPELLPFDRLVLRAWADVPSDMVAFDEVGLTGVDKKRAEAFAVGGGREGIGAPKPAKLSIDCRSAGHSISPLIYGIAFNNLGEEQDTHQWALGATARRWGGNPTSRYNWKLGNAWNTAEDYYFRNVVLGKSASYTYESFLEANLKHGLRTALTVPMLGWVAKDTTSFSFPVSRFGEQAEADPDVPEAGNGLSRNGKKLKPPTQTQTSEPAPPEFIAEWVRTIRAKDKERGRSVHMYLLDNEPMLWNTTHWDVHPDAVTYDELLEKTVAYATAVRQEDPEAVIAGPALWGWTAYFRSAADEESTRRRKHWDTRAHGDVPLLPWYLKRLREHEQKTGVRLLDVVDVHFYPQADGVGIGESGGTDEETAALRIRSTRALWDETYKDESWIEEPVKLIPRLRAWVDENYPGRGISIGEYNFGATRHMSGGLAQAEALGRFAETGITSAFLWTYPPDGSPAYWAFRAFRNFDGKGGRFQDTYVPSHSEEGLSLFASRDDKGKHVVAILLNLEPDSAREAMVQLDGCGDLEEARALRYSGQPTGFSGQALEAKQLQSLRVVLPPYSMTVLDLTLKAEKKASGPTP